MKKNHNNKRPKKAFKQNRKAKAKKAMTKRISRSQFALLTDKPTVVACDPSFLDDEVDPETVKGREIYFEYSGEEMTPEEFARYMLKFIGAKWVLSFDEESLGEERLIKSKEIIYRILNENGITTNSN